jgi:hypothetical protein
MEFLFTQNYITLREFKVIKVDFFWIDFENKFLKQLLNNNF